MNAFEAKRISDAANHKKKHLCGRSRLDNYPTPFYIINSSEAKLNCFRRTCTDD